MSIDNLTEQSKREALVDFINDFLEGHLRERWLCFASMKKIPWGKIDPYGVYVGASPDCTAAQPLKCKSIASVVDSYQLSEMKNDYVWVFSTGHGAKGASRIILNTALSGVFPLEGFIVVRPGKFVVCLGHHGDVWVLTK